MDFRSDEGFYGIVETSSKEEIAQKEKEEEKELLEEEKEQTVSHEEDKKQQKPLKDNKTEDAPIILGNESLHIKQRQPQSFNEALAWVVRKLNKELGIELIENITIRMRNGQRLYFDAFFRGEKFIYVLEVKLMRQPIDASLVRGRLNDFLLSVDKLKRRNDNVKSIIAIVGIHWNENIRRNYKEQLKQAFPSDFEIEVFDYERLKGLYK